jgi:hypothetical protein
MHLMTDCALPMIEAATRSSGGRCSLVSPGMVAWARVSFSADEPRSSNSRVCQCTNWPCCSKPELWLQGPVGTETIHAQFRFYVQCGIWG